MRYFENPYVHTSQFVPEFDHLIALYEELQPMTVLEIGSEFGGTLWQWLHRAPDGARVMNIDPLISAQECKGIDIIRIWQSWARPEIVFRTIVGFSQNPEVAKAALEWLGESIDFLFVDGDHTYRGAKMDWDLYAPHAKVIVFHDLIKHQPHFGTPKLFEEIKSEGYKTQEFYSDTRQSGGGIGVVYND